MAEASAQRTAARQAADRQTAVEVVVGDTVRPRAWDAKVPWRHVDVRDATKATPEIATSAVFVVHGMGTQSSLDTQTELRDGFEDQVERLRRDHGLHRVPPPFVYEGYWADYDDLEATFPDEWRTFAERERSFFSKLWTRRALGGLRSLFWVLGQALRLVVDPRVYRGMSCGPGTKALRWLTYAGMLALSVVVFPVLWFWKRKVITEVLSDVRVYVDPRGVVERAIVQRIDRRVGGRFLQLLGLDWDFRDLEDDARLTVSGEATRFERVTWVAHSLGSVVSYNVVSDILARGQALREELARPGRTLTDDDRRRLANVARVEDGLHRFVTIGSPLEKIALLFPQALRAWPLGHVRERLGHGRRWWTNVYHLWDPVSGRLRDPRFFPEVNNVHPRLLRVPGLAHVAYWHDASFLQYVISRTYGTRAYRLPEVRFLPAWRVAFARGVTVPALALLMGAALVGFVYVVAWGVTHPVDVALAVWRFAAARAGLA